MPSPKHPLIVRNWKMNGLKQSPARISLVAAAVRDPGGNIDVVLCPPDPPLSLGAQDCSIESQGAYTGDISAAMLADAGAKCVIFGYSDRRQGRGESEGDIARKGKRVLASDLNAIVCIGGTEARCWMA